MRLGKLAACGGVAGPLLFTAACVVSSLRQTDLAAEDARDPQIMMAAFVVLGACSIAFGAALRRVAGHSAAGHVADGSGQGLFGLAMRLARACRQAPLPEQP